MVKWLIGLFLMMVILAPLVSIVNLSFDISQGTAIESIVNAKLFNGGDIITPLTYIRALLNAVTFSYLYLPGAWIWLKYALYAVSIGVTYGIVLNWVKKTSAS